MTPPIPLLTFVLRLGFRKNLILRRHTMGANHAGERKRKKLKNTKKILRTQLKKAKAKGA